MSTKSRLKGATRKYAMDAYGLTNEQARRLLDGPLPSPAKLAREKRIEAEELSRVAADAAYRATQQRANNAASYKRHLARPPVRPRSLRNAILSAHARGMSTNSPEIWALALAHEKYNNEEKVRETERQRRARYQLDLPRNERYPAVRRRMTRPRIHHDVIKLLKDLGLTIPKTGQIGAGLKWAEIRSILRELGIKLN